MLWGVRVKLDRLGGQGSMWKGVGRGWLSSAAVLSKWLWTFSAMDSFRLSILESGVKCELFDVVGGYDEAGKVCYFGRIGGEGSGR